MKKVLIIAYLFPPIGGGGVQRALKMAKYMKEFGWDPHILTVDPTYHVSLDYSLLKQLPDDIVIHRVKEINLGRNPAATAPAQAQEIRDNPGLLSKFKQWLFPYLKKIKHFLFVPDDQILWAPLAINKGKHIIKEYGIDAILSTSGPVSNHLVALFLKRSYGLPWIADFRDPWTQNMHRTEIRWRAWLENRLERMVHRESDLLLTVTHSFAENFQKKFAEEIRRIEVVHNGFDPADYAELKDQRVDRSICVLAYTGIFYQERNPRLLLSAVKELIDEGHLERKRIALQFAGVFDYPGYTENQDQVKELGLPDVVQIVGHLPHQQALQLLKEADILLLIGDTAEGSGRYIPGKLFEYMAVGHPILALSLPGESTAIIESYQLGKVADPNSLEAVKRALLELYKLWERGEEQQVEGRPSTLLYQRKEQTKQIALLLDDLT
jgi:glycosyltransferase involved in cell wall biosynthesis